MSIQDAPSSTPDPIIVICRGLPASGKTTFALAWVAGSPETRSRVNRDTIRQNYFNALWGESVNEMAVGRISENIIENMMRLRRDIVVDDTNLPADRVKPLLELARTYMYQVEIREFDVPLEELITRDAAREKKVGAEVITMLRDRWFTKDRMPEIVL
jgi:predicted kinase